MFNRTSFCTKANCTSPLTGFPKQESACTIHFLWQLLGPVFIHCASLNPGGPYSTLLMTHCLQTEADTVYRLWQTRTYERTMLSWCRHPFSRPCRFRDLVLTNYCQRAEKDAIILLQGLCLLGDLWPRDTLKTKPIYEKASGLTV